MAATDATTVRVAGMWGRMTRQALRYILNRVLFWRRCWWCKHGGFGGWPDGIEPEAVCRLLSKPGHIVTVAHNDFCSRWEAIRDE